MDRLALSGRAPRLLARTGGREAWLLAGLDLSVIVLCFAAGRAANYLFSGTPWIATWYQWRMHYGDLRIAIFLGLALACLITFWQLGHYARRRPFWQELGDVLAVVATLAILDAALVFLTKTEFSRLWWASSWTLVALLVPAARLALRRLLLASGRWQRPTVIIGTGPNALDAALALAGEPLLGFEVVAFIAPPDAPPVGQEGSPAWLEIGGRRLPVLRAAPDPSSLPAQLGRPHVVVALELRELARCGAYVERLNLHYGDVDVVSPMRGLPLAGTHVTHFFSHDVLSLRLYNNLARPWPRRLKRAVDLVAGSLLCLFVAPLFGLISWQVARTGRPVLYRHERIGKGGRRFECLKFRTMVADADRVLADHLAAHPEAAAAWRRDRRLERDPRITRIGAWLRRTSLEQLPQLINVVRGEMSLVGPRPVVAEELARYGDDIVYYVESTPGLTGLSQVSGRSPRDERRRVHLDCWYVKNWSLWYDLVILLKTPRALLRGHGAG